jgi:hypothetical protein
MCQNEFCVFFVQLRHYFDINLSNMIMSHLKDDYERYLREIDFTYLRRQIGPFTQQFMIPSYTKCNNLIKQPLAQLSELYSIIGGGSSNLFVLDQHHIECILGGLPSDGWIMIALCGCGFPHQEKVLSICIEAGHADYGCVKIGQIVDNHPNDFIIYRSLHHFALEWIKYNEDKTVRFCTLLSHKTNHVNYYDLDNDSDNDS